MLTTRIVGVINLLNGIVVQSIRFNEYLPIGKPEVAINYLDSWGADEIILLNINRQTKSKNSLIRNLLSYSKFCQTPLAVGGGIKSLRDIELLIRNGADKVVINTNGHLNPNLFREGAKEFGEQAIVASFDVKKIGKNFYAFINSGKVKLEMDLKDLLKQSIDNGAGEIFLNSIDRDGTKSGFDLELIKFVSENISIPLIGCGGAGKASDFIKAMPLKISGLAAGNILNFSEHSVTKIKSIILKKYKNIRLDTISNYQNKLFDKDGRLLPMNDKTIDKLRFDYIPKEKI